MTEFFQHFRRYLSLVLGFSPHYKSWSKRIRTCSTRLSSVVFGLRYFRLYRLINVPALDFSKIFMNPCFIPPNIAPKTSLSMLISGSI